MNAPGLIVYLDHWPKEIRRSLTNEQAGELFLAMIDYAQTGALPKLKAPIQQVIFTFARGDIDRANEKYEKTRQRTSYSNYCKQMLQMEEVPVPFAVWKNEA